MTQRSPALANQSENRGAAPLMLLSNFDILRFNALANQSEHRGAAPLMLLSNFDISKQRSPALANQSEHQKDPSFRAPSGTRNRV